MVKDNKIREFPKDPMAKEGNKKMKRLIVYALIVCQILVLSGCTLTEPAARVYIDEMPNNIYEWISPDGVHYWVMREYSMGGIAPRYRRNGDLVID